MPLRLAVCRGVVPLTLFVLLPTLGQPVYEAMGYVAAREPMMRLKL